MALVCFHGENPHVINQKRADAVLQILSEPERRRIMDSIKDDFKTASQIAEETEIHVSVAYRRLHELNEKNILRVTGRIPPGKKSKEMLYKSKIRKVIATYDKGDVDVKIYTNVKDE